MAKRMKNVVIVDTVTGLAFEATRKMEKDGTEIYKVEGEGNTLFDIENTGTFIEIDKKIISNGGRLDTYISQGNNLKYIEGVMSAGLDKPVRINQVYNGEYADKTNLGFKWEEILAEIKNLDEEIKTEYGDKISSKAAKALRLEGLNGIIAKYDIGKDVRVWDKCTQQDEKMSYKDAVAEVNDERAISNGLSERVRQELQVNALENRVESFKDGARVHSKLQGTIGLGVTTLGGVYTLGAITLASTLGFPAIAFAASVTAVGLYNIFRAIAGKFKSSADKSYYKELKAELKEERVKLHELEKAESKMNKEAAQEVEKSVEIKSKDIDSPQESNDSKHEPEVENKEPEKEKVEDPKTQEDLEARVKSLEDKVADQDKKLEAKDKEIEELKEKLEDKDKSENSEDEEESEDESEEQTDNTDDEENDEELEEDSEDEEDSKEETEDDDTSDETDGEQKVEDLEEDLEEDNDQSENSKDDSKLETEPRIPKTNQEIEDAIKEKKAEQKNELLAHKLELATSHQGKTIEYNADESKSNHIVLDVVSTNPLERENDSQEKLELYSSKDNTRIDTVGNGEVDVTFNKNIRLNVSENFDKNLNIQDNIGKMISDKGTESNPIEIKAITLTDENGAEHILNQSDIRELNPEQLADLKEKVEGLIGEAATDDFFEEFESASETIEELENSENLEDVKQDTETSEESDHDDEEAPEADTVDNSDEGIFALDDKDFLDAFDTDTE